MRHVTNIHVHCNAWSSAQKPRGRLRALNSLNLHVNFSLISTCYCSLLPYTFWNIFSAIIILINFKVDETGIRYRIYCCKYTKKYRPILLSTAMWSYLTKVILLPVSCFLKQYEETNDLYFRFKQLFKERQYIYRPNFKYYVCNIFF